MPTDNLDWIATASVPLCAALLPTMPRATSALDYSTRPMYIIVGFASAGGTDIMARLIGQLLSERLDKQFTVENRPGAGTNVATEAVVNAPADGYMLLLVCLPLSFRSPLVARAIVFRG